MKEIITNSGHKIMVDDEDYEKLSSIGWWVTDSGYVRSQKMTKGKRKSLWIHREIIGAPDGQFVDHKNHNKLDNRKENLRLCNTGLNKANSRKITKRKTSSRFKGVSFVKSRQKYRAYVRYNWKVYHLGYFSNEEDAAMAYDVKAKELFGDFAFTNRQEGLLE